MDNPSIDDIIKAIKDASENNPTAFKKLQQALKVEADSSYRDYSSESDSKALEMLEKRAKLQSDFNKAKDLEFQKEIARLKELGDKYKDQVEDMAGLQETITNIKNGVYEGDGGDTGIKEVDDQINALIKLAEEEENYRKAVEEGRDKTAEARAGDLADLIGLSKYSTSTLGKFQDFFASMSDGTDAAKGEAVAFGRALAKAFSPQAIGLTVFNKVFSESMKVLKAFDEAAASLAKTTGTVGKFNDVLYDTQRSGNLLGVTMDNVASSIAALNSGTSQFAQLNKQTQTDIAITATQMEKLGVSSADTAAFMENAFKIMNMSAREAITAQTELAMAGVQLGIGADKIVKDFNAASKTLAVYGKNSIGVFKDLAAQAKAAGVEVSTLLGIVEKFDTFSGAAEGAAKFNALLGTQLSTTQMLMMTEDERMKTIIESVQAQGVAFGDMDKYTQKAIAAAAGISDMNEANRIFSMSLSDYEANARELENNADAQRRFDDAVQATVPTMKKFQNLATEMIVMVQPALETLGDIADYLTEAFQGMSKETKEMIGTVGLVLGGLLAIMPLFAVGGGFMAGLAAIGPAIAGIGTGIASAVAAITAVTATGIGAGVLGALVVAGGGIALTMASIAASKAKMAEANAEIAEKGSQTIQAMADVGNADFSNVAANFQGVLKQLDTMSTNVKVTSTLQNLALVGTSTAFDLTGAKIAASSTTVTANIQNIFDGATMVLDVGNGRKFEGYIRQVAATTAVT